MVQGVGSTVWLAPVPYYAAFNHGPVSFTINLWFKAGNATGGLFQYLLSHMGNADGNEWGPNQVHAHMASESGLAKSRTRLMMLNIRNVATSGLSYITWHKS